jgi:hypothetical protein
MISKCSAGESERSVKTARRAKNDPIFGRERPLQGMPACELFMVIVLLQGGLGNQMFQYASALGTCHAGEALYADLHTLYDRTTDSATFTPRRYGLGIFPNLRIRKIPNLVHSIFNRPELPWRIMRRLVGGRFARIGQYNNEFFPELLKRRRSVYLDGYFQSEKYFLPKRAELLSDFAFPELDEENAMLAAAIRSRKDAVSIHIRRGDYLKPEILRYHGILTLEYYQECIRQIRSQTEQPHFYIFSDDPAWCRENLGLEGPEVTYIGDQNADAAWKDMCLMTHCAHHVVANSSFSWWGAWLSQRNGLNFAPADWFNPKNVSFEIGDIVPEGWKIVS